MKQKYRKTLLALAITSVSLHGYGATLQLNNNGLVVAAESYSEPVEITGSFSGNVSDDDEWAVVTINSQTFEKDLTLNANINANGIDATAIDFLSGTSTGSGTWSSKTQIEGDVIQKGNISVTGQAGEAILLDTNTTIEGDLRNEGTLSVKGTPIYETPEGDWEDSIDGATVIDFGFSAEIEGNLVNSTSGKILAEGDESIGINMEGGHIGGRAINDGLIQVQGKGAVGIDATSAETGRSGERVKISGITNNGTISAEGEDAHGMLLDGVNFTGSDAQVINNGTIQATDAAIEIEQLDIAQTATALVIRNSGTITSEEEAIDAQEASQDVELEWDKGTITGNLIGLSNIEVLGEVTFNGTDLKNDPANISLKEEGWLNVGSNSQNIAASLQLEGTQTSIDGNLYVAGNSSLGLTLSPATAQDKAIAKVSGTAEFAEGSQIKLRANGDDFKASGNTYTLLEAGELKDEGLSVTSSSLLLNVDSYSSKNNQIVAIVTSKNQQEVGAVIEQAGGSTNAQQAVGSFSQLSANLAQNNPNDVIFQAYVNASENPAALKSLAEQLAPEVNSGATQAATGGQALVSSVTSNRTSSLRGASSGDVLQNTGVWVQTLYSEANQDLRDGVVGYNAYSSGIAIGADTQLSEQLTLGLAYSFLNSSVNSDNGNSTEVDGHSFSLYGGFTHGNYFVDANLSYGFNDNQSERHIVGTTAKADYDSTVLGANVIGGYSYALNDQVLLEPRLAARYAQVDIDSYSEKGSSAALKIDSQSYEVAELGAGLRVAGDLQLGKGRLQPQAKLMAYHDFAADQSKSTSTFLLGGTPFVSQGSDPVRNSYEAGVGANYLLGAVTLGVSYDYAGKTDFNANTFTAKVRYDF